MHIIQAMHLIFFHQNRFFSQSNSDTHTQTVREFEATRHSGILFGNKKKLFACLLACLSVYLSVLVCLLTCKSNFYIFMCNSYILETQKKKLTYNSCLSLSMCVCQQIKTQKKFFVFHYYYYYISVAAADAAAVGYYEFDKTCFFHHHHLHLCSTTTTTNNNNDDDYYY